MRRFNRGVAWYTEIMYSSRVQYSSYSADPDRPSADEMAAIHRRMNPPVNEQPVPLPVNLVVARAENVVVALSGVDVYSVGFAFTLRVRLRTRPVRAHQMHLLIGGYGGADTDPEQRLLVGIEFADGRRASSAVPDPAARADPQRPLLTGGGGSGGDVAMDRVNWVTPLPPDGPLLVVVRCGALGVPESTVRLDGGEIARAAEQVTVLWPPPPPATMQDRRPPRLPSDGWFSRLT